MSLIDIVAGDITPELLKLLVMVASTVYGCKGIAGRLITLISDVQPTIREIQHSGVQLSEHRQTQMRIFFEILEKARKLSEKVLRCSRLNPKHVYYANKMKDLEKKIFRFLSTSVLVNILADVNRNRLSCESRFDRIEKTCDRINEGMESLSLEKAVKMAEVTVEFEMKVDPAVQEEVLDRGKRKVKEMMSKYNDVDLFGISGMSGSGKTTLAEALLRDAKFRGLFRDRILFMTVSAYPNLENLRSLIKGFLDYGPQNRKLVILDDVWTKESLDMLMFKIPGAITLVVSRVNLAGPRTTYNVELLKGDEATSVFCVCAFGTKSPPHQFRYFLVKQVVDECKGLPLSLKVLGALLKDQPDKCWEGALKRLSRRETSSESRVFAHIEESLHSLDPITRECFFDLAAFPEDKKISIDVVTNMLVEMHDIDEETAISILVCLSQNNLLTLVRFDPCYNNLFVKQHDVLRDLALHLSSQGDVNRRDRLLMPRRDSMLPREWKGNNNKPFDARIVSIHTWEMNELDWFDMELPKTEVLMLNFFSDKYVLPPFICKMSRLKALVIINNSVSFAYLHGFPLSANLRSLWLERFQVPELSSSTISLRNLHKMHLILCKMNKSFDRVDLDISNIFPSLSNLTIDHCYDFVKPSTICGITSLNSLSITNCPRILELPKSLSKLQSLETLRLHACLELKVLPVEISELPCLECLDISQCINIKSLPEKIGNLKKLEKIDMTECSLWGLPGSVDALESLRHVICDNGVYNTIYNTRT